jgi:hypothetical protein
MQQEAEFRFQNFLLSGYARREVAKDAVCINDDSMFNPLKTICEYVNRQVKHSAILNKQSPT